MTSHAPDILDRLAEVLPEGPVDDLRRRRPVTRTQLQASYDALFQPVDDSEFPVAERWLVAGFATRLTADDATAAHYAGLAQAADPSRAGTVLAEASAAATAGPFGTYAEAGLQDENTDGRRYEPSPATRDALGGRVATALTHAHLLTAHPREAGSAALDRLLEAGWSIDGIVTLSQLVSFLAFQQRVAAGLRVLARTTTATTEEVPA